MADRSSSHSSNPPKDHQIAASGRLHWPPRHKRELIEHAKLAYAAHMEQMILSYPELRMTPWNDQDAAVREAWIEHITPVVSHGRLPLLPELKAEEDEACHAILDWIGVARHHPDPSDPLGLTQGESLALAERVRILALELATRQGYTLEEAERLAPAV